MENSIGFYPRGAREGERMSTPTGWTNMQRTKLKEKQQPKMRCLTGKQVERRTGPVPGETQEKSGQKSTYRVQTLHAPQAPPYVRHSEHRWVMWPTANKERKCLQFDEDLNQVLEATAKGDVDQKLQMMAAMIISIGAERFGIKDQQPTRC